MPAVSSAAGLLALLAESNDDLKCFALVNLDKVVHEYWFQISGSIGSVEALYEDDEFSHRELAALLASKVGNLGTLHHTAARRAVRSSPMMELTMELHTPHTHLGRCSTTWVNWTTR